MKKAIIVAILCCVASLFTVPAHAEDTEADWAARGCSATTNKAVQKTLAFEHSNGVTETVLFVVKVYYRDCGNSAYVSSFSIGIDPSYNGCLNPLIGSALVQNYKANMNAIGDWNPGEKTIDCDGNGSGYRKDYNNTATNKYVFASDPSNERCFSASVQVSLNNRDDKTGTTGTACIL